jgi:hypothetical protein
VRVFPNGRTVHIPSDGQPLPGYALALADIQKRGSSAPSEMSLASAQLAGVDTSSARSAHPKSLLASLFHLDDDEDDQAQAAPAPSRPASLTSAVDAKAEPSRAAAVPVPLNRPQRMGTALAAVVASADGPPASSGRDRYALASLAEAPRPSDDIPHVPLSNHDRAPAVTPWPYRDDKDHVPLDMVLAYADQTQHENASDFESRFGAVGQVAAHGAASGTTRGMSSLRERDARDSNAAPKKNAASVRTPATVPVVRVRAAAAAAGSRYDDPWLRALILAPQLYGAMTATLYGDPDFTELRSLMSKPATAVVISFTKDPYPGMTSSSFSGEAVVFPATYVFAERTAWLH